MPSAPGASSPEAGTGERNFRGRKPVQALREGLSYDEAVSEHRWVVPEHYNIAADVCDKHPREKLAMVHEHFSGAVREVRWGELQDIANKLANVLAGWAWSEATGSPSCCRPTPEAAGVFFATWKLGALLLSMSVLYGDEGIEHRARRLAAARAGDRRRERGALLAPERPRAADARPRHTVRRVSRSSTPSTRSPMTRHSSITPRAPRGWRRA